MRSSPALRKSLAILMYRQIDEIEYGVCGMKSIIIEPADSSYHKLARVPDASVYVTRTYSLSPWITSVK